MSWCDNTGEPKGTSADPICRINVSSDRDSDNSTRRSGSHSNNLTEMAFVMAVSIQNRQMQMHRYALQNKETSNNVR